MTHLLKESDIENLATIYDLQIIEVYYYPINLTNNYLEAPSITDDILGSIFTYLAHHEMVIVYSANQH